MFKEDIEISLLQRQKLPLYLKPLNIAKLTLIDSLEHNAYAYKDGIFNLVLEEDEIIDSEFIKNFALTIGNEIFINEKDYYQLQETLSEELMKMTRSLSIGDPLKNSYRQANLLTFQMDNLYADPFDSALLLNQFQGAKNLTGLLLNNAAIVKDLYHKIDLVDHHFVLKQPLVASILLVAFLKDIKAFSPRENENLFLTSYFKDIGMSFVSKQTWDEINLSEFEKESLCNHTINSVNILEGRIPLSKKYLNMIENHNLLNNKTDRDARELMAIGIETTLINAVDVFVAMINDRPYRSKYTVYKALEFLKILISDEYPQEYKALVRFLLKFMKK